MIFVCIFIFKSKSKRWCGMTWNIGRLLNIVLFLALRIITIMINILLISVCRFWSLFFFLIQPCCVYATEVYTMYRILCLARPFSSARAVQITLFLWMSAYVYSDIWYISQAPSQTVSCSFSFSHMRNLTDNRSWTARRAGYFRQSTTSTERI